MPPGDTLARASAQLVEHGYLVADQLPGEEAPTISPAMIDAARASLELMDPRWEPDLRERVVVGSATADDLIRIGHQLSLRTCGVRDGRRGGIGPAIFGPTGGEKWNRTVLTWSVNSGGCNLSNAEVRTATATALAHWAVASRRLMFLPTAAAGDIRISFEEDSEGILRAGGTVDGLGYYPMDGRVLLNPNTVWTPGWLLSMLIHEIGHALGLGHSNDATSMMYPTVPTNQVLDAESVEAIRLMYQWPPQIPLTDRQTSHRPAMAESSFSNFSGRTVTLHSAWKGPGSDQGIYTSFLTSSNAWSSQQRVSSVGTSRGPALAPVNAGTRQDLMMAWKGINDDQGIYWATNTGPAESPWTSQRRIEFAGTSEGPALANIDGRLFMAWKGAHADSGIYFSEFVGGNWAGQKRVYGVGTSSSPAIVGMGGLLYLFWKGIEGDPKIYWSSLDIRAPNALWEPQRLVQFEVSETTGRVFVAVGTSFGPTATARANRIFLSWKGMNDDRRIWFSLFDGADFTGQTYVMNVGTEVAPTACCSGGIIHMLWKGIHEDHHIYWTTT